MKKLTKPISILLSVLLLTSLLTLAPITASATVTSGSTGDCTWWFDDNSGVLTITGSGNMADYGYEDENRAPWYAFRESINKIVIDNDVVTIGDYAFDESCATEVEIGNQVNIIGSCAFAQSHLSKVDIPESVEEIGETALGYYYDSDSEEYRKTEGFTIGGYQDTAAETYAKENGFTFNNLDTSKKYDLWVGARQVTYRNKDDVFRDGGSVSYSSYTNTLMLSDAEISGTHTNNGGAVCVISAENMNLTVTGNGTISDASGDYGISVSGGSVTMDGDFRIVGKVAAINADKDITFESGELDLDGGIVAQEDIAFEAGVIYVDITTDEEDEADQALVAFGSVQMDKNLQIAGDKKITFASNETYTTAVDEDGNPVKNLRIEEKAFSYSGVTGDCVWSFDRTTGTLIINGSGKMADYEWDDENYGTTAPWDVFRGSIKDVSIDSGVTHIGSYAFYGCSEEELVIPDNVTTIDENAFRYNQRLKKLTLGKKLNTIGKEAFSFCDSIEELKIPDSVEIIEDKAFNICRGLKKLKLGRGLKTIDDRAFFDCGNLKEVTILDNVKTIGESAFGYGYNGTPVEGFTIKGYDDSAAEAYANSYEHITFVSLGSASQLGDVNNDDKIDVTDATYIQMAVAKMIKLTEAQQIAADTNNDGKVDVTDATYIQMYTAKIIPALG